MKKKPNKNGDVFTMAETGFDTWVATVLGTKVGWDMETIRPRGSPIGALMDLYATTPWTGTMKPESPPEPVLAEELHRVLRRDPKLLWDTMKLFQGDRILGPWERDHLGVSMVRRDLAGEIRYNVIEDRNGGFYSPMSHGLYDPDKSASTMGEAETMDLVDEWLRTGGDGIGPWTLL